MLNFRRSRAVTTSATDLRPVASIVSTMSLSQVLQGEPPYAVPPELLPVGEKFPRPVAWATGGIAAAVGVASVWCTASGSLIWGTACAVLFGVFAVLAFAFDLGDAIGRPPQLLNAVVLGRAVVAPADDWVHFYQEQAMHVWVRAWMILSGIGTGVLLVVSMIAVLATPTGVWWLFLFIPLLVGCAVVGVYALLQNLLDAKNSSFGRIPVGLTLGRSGITRHLVAGADFVRWEHITAVEVAPHARIRICRGAAEPLEFTAGMFEERAGLIYNAIRLYYEQPQLRTELSTTEAQQRFESWRRAW